MRRLGWRLWVPAGVSIVAAILLAVPVGRLGATATQRKEALAPAAEVDVCRMLKDFLRDRRGELPEPTRVDAPGFDETVAMRHPHRARAGCELGDNDTELGPDRIRLRSVALTVTTMASHQRALDRLQTLIARVNLGPGAITDIANDRATLAGFLADDHSSWQVVAHYVSGPYNVAFFVRFDEDDQQLDAPKVVGALDEMVERRLDPDEYLVG